MQGFMPPDAFTFDTSGQLVMQTAIGGAKTLFERLLGAAGLALVSAISKPRCTSGRPGNSCGG